MSLERGGTKKLQDASSNFSAGRTEELQRGALENPLSSPAISSGALTLSAI